LTDSHEYSLTHYGAILDRAKDLDYRVVRVVDVVDGAAGERFLLVRHDVDITPWAALAMASFERERGVYTSYYFRLHAPTYNFLDPEVLDAARRIADWGHEVGLHYEPGVYLTAGQDPVEGTRRDLRAFEDALGRRTRTIAQHQPAEGPVLDTISPEHVCAYGPAFVRDIPYFADSGFHWREGCICTKLGRHPKIHTLIHPHSWTIAGVKWQDVLRRHAEDLTARLRDQMEAYIASVEEYLRRRPELDREREKLYTEKRSRT
jgi:hypothetical protein